MGALSDMMLAGSCAVLIEDVHAETVVVLTGPDAGKCFLAVKEVEPDLVFDGAVGIDPRAKRVLRFRDGTVPNLKSQDRIRTEDGRLWNAVRRPDSAYLTVDFELSEVTPKDTATS